MRVVHITDTHLSHLGGVTTRNFEAVVAFVNGVIKPDLVINTGDVVMLSPDSDLDREAARVLHEGFEAPLRVIAGNHDVGEVGENAWMGIQVSDERVAAFSESFGPSRFAEVYDGFAIVGINSEVLSSGLDAEVEQWEWLETLVPELDRRSVLLCSHKPLWSPFGEVPGHAIAINNADRLRLLSLFADAPVEIAASGHLHRYIKGETDSITTISAPSTAFLASSEALVGPGLQQLGIVEYEIEKDSMTAVYRSIRELEECTVWDIPEVSATKTAIETASVA
jgi:3',5'-cyclic AMP phosphodiesterase CpdA